MNSRSERNRRVRRACRSSSNGTCSTKSLALASRVVASKATNLQMDDGLAVSDGQVGNTYARSCCGMPQTKPRTLDRTRRRLTDGRTGAQPRRTAVRARATVPCAGGGATTRRQGPPDRGPSGTRGRVRRVAPRLPTGRARRRRAACRVPPVARAATRRVRDVHPARKCCLSSAGKNDLDQLPFCGIDFERNGRRQRLARLQTFRCGPLRGAAWIPSLHFALPLRTRGTVNGPARAAMSPSAACNAVPNAIVLQLAEVDTQWMSMMDFHQVCLNKWRQMAPAEASNAGWGAVYWRSLLVRRGR
jgi:hypothetical protein